MAKPHNTRLAIVTASRFEDPVTLACRGSWDQHSTYELPHYVVGNQFGVVGAFAEGVALAIEHGAEAICCFHDDLRIDQDGWDEAVMAAVEGGVQFAGFGGAVGLGDSDLYQTPYRPQQLVRHGFVSNLQDAEAHGRRSKQTVPCVCFDGFCQIGTADWFGDAWQMLTRLGFVHHFYDGALGCFAARLGKQPGLMLPVACHHYGGRTAVGSVSYSEWAREQRPNGDADFWEESHRIGYAEFADVLPLRVENFL